MEPLDRYMLQRLAQFNIAQSAAYDIHNFSKVCHISLFDCCSWSWRSASICTTTRWQVWLQNSWQQRYQRFIWKSWRTGHEDWRMLRKISLAIPCSLVTQALLGDPWQQITKVGSRNFCVSFSLKMFLKYRHLFLIRSCQTVLLHVFENVINLVFLCVHIICLSFSFLISVFRSYFFLWI